MNTPSSLRSLVNRAQKSLDSGLINDALLIIHNFVDRIITDPLCVAQVFSSQDLDSLCLSIGNRNLTFLKDQSQKPIDLCRNNRPTIIYVVSRLQSSGGHLRLIRDFIEAQPEKDHIVLSTEVAGPSDGDHLSKIFLHSNNFRFICSPKVSLHKRLIWLQKILLGTQADHIHLLNHHQDSVAIAALVPELNLAGTFHHHGDHHLCLGVHMAHLTHVDIHPMGYHYCREHLGINNYYLPLTFKDKGFEISKNSNKSMQPLITATAARHNKVEVPYVNSYIDAVPQILKITGGTHVHIGRLTPWALYRIKMGMHRLGVDINSFIYIDWTPSVWLTLQEYEVDVYISSFPYPAALTLVEAMGAGIPIILHKHIYSRVLSCLELAYPEAYKWDYIEELYNHLSSLDRVKLSSERQLARNQYEAFHRPEILQAYFKNSLNVIKNIPKLSAEFRSKADEWAGWVNSQRGISDIVFIYIYRAFRKLRNDLSNIKNKYQWK